MRTRPLFTPTRAVCGLVLLAALVVGGLAWVSVTALQAEADRRRAAHAADLATREHLALWRLDSHMISPLVVENNRPISNYLCLAPPAPLVLMGLVSFPESVGFRQVTSASNQPSFGSIGLHE